MNKYNGSSDVSDFLRQFNLIAAVNRYDDEAKKMVIAAYLDGPPLYFYRAIVDSCQPFDEIKNKLISEFSRDVDYVAAFYARNQHPDEDLLTFYYALEECAAKAGPVITDNVFIKHLLKMCTYPNKCRLASTVYNDKKTLKETIVQMGHIFGKQPDMHLYLPVHISSTATAANIAQPVTEQSTSSTGSGDRFRTPVTEQSTSSPGSGDRFRTPTLKM